MFISLKRETPPVTDRDHLSLLLPTRGRPQMLAEVFESLEKTVKRKDKFAVWLYIDHDDQVTLDAINAGNFKKFTYSINWVVGDRTASLGEIHNLTWRACTSGSGIFMLHADDTSFVTEGWDDIIRAAYDKYPDRILVAHPHDPALHEPTFQMILSAEWMAVTGYFSTAHFPFWFDDMWLDHIGKLIGRREQLPIRLGLIGGKGTTTRMRNMGFWTQFFNLTLDERIQTAQALQKAMRPEPGRTASAEIDPALIRQFQEEGSNFSDLYAIFREERHSSLSEAQRRSLDERYFNLEAKAVARLLAKAQALLKDKRYDEATKLLDAVLLSDLRTKHLNYLKSECLRAAGNQSEADRLLQENAQIWPENRMVRRLFRFIAYIFVEAKRMVFSKW